MSTKNGWKMCLSTPQPVSSKKSSTIPAFSNCVNSLLLKRDLWGVNGFGYVFILPNRPHADTDLICVVGVIDFYID